MGGKPRMTPKPSGATSRRSAPSDARRRLPSVDDVLRCAAAAPLHAAHPRVRAVEAVRAVLDARRSRGPTGSTPDADEIAACALRWLDEDEFQRLRPVVNATGVILHTNLGRAVLPAPAARALAGLDRCCSLQIDLETGRRGQRHAMTERLLCRLTGAEAALVVNNNAAATLLVLAALCNGREVVVSRGQLIEIGGSFRLPDCIHQAGARLHEVGTTNKTHLRDYEAALGENTAAVLRVHPSNYRVVGFTREVSTAELAALKNGRPGLRLFDDLGAGALLDTRLFGLPAEPTVADSLRAGADLAFFSGDKLIGGPQSGIIVGRADLVAEIRRHPLTRMLRVDKMTDLALERTLRLFLEPEQLAQAHPTWRMLTLPAASLRARARKLVARTVRLGAPRDAMDIQPCESTTGGGSLPGYACPSFALAVAQPGLAAETLLRRLRRNDPPVIGRIQDDSVWLDLRTVFEEEDRLLAQALATALTAPDAAGGSR